MKALLFPGQGSQSVGMGKELYKNFDIVKKIFSEADEKLSFSISKIILFLTHMILHGAKLETNLNILQYRT